TDYVETRSGQASRYAEYAQRGKKGYEIEHVWADHPERHTDEFGHPSEFQEYRNRVGGLVLLPKSFNASYGDLPYEEKRKHYAGQNLLARSLHESAYDHNPGFKRLIAESGMPFRAHAEFKKADLDARQALYQQLAERIWSPERLAQEAASCGKRCALCARNRCGGSSRTRRIRTPASSGWGRFRPTGRSRASTN